jgi:hypothetical protein
LGREIKRANRGSYARTPEDSMAHKGAYPCHNKVSDSANVGGG